MHREDVYDGKRRRRPSRDEQTRCRSESTATSDAPLSTRVRTISAVQVGDDIANNSGVRWFVPFAFTCAPSSINAPRALPPRGARFWTALNQISGPRTYRCARVSESGRYRPQGPLVTRGSYRRRRRHPVPPLRNQSHTWLANPRRWPRLVIAGTSLNTGLFNSSIGANTPSASPNVPPPSWSQFEPEPKVSSLSVRHATR